MATQTLCRFLLTTQISLQQITALHVYFVLGGVVHLHVEPPLRGELTGLAYEYAGLHAIQRGVGAEAVDVFERLSARSTRYLPV